MPIYEYRCADCHQVFEEWCKRVTDAEDGHACPICNGQAHRLISHTSFALRGEGWYVTEYGTRKNTPEKTADAAASTSGPASAPSAPSAFTPAPAPPASVAMASSGAVTAAAS